MNTNSARIKLWCLKLNNAQRSEEAMIYEEKILNEYQALDDERVLLTAEVERLKAERRWIPVVDKYPPDWKTVMGFSQKHAYYGPFRTFWSGSQWGSAIDDEMIPTHWQFFPAPPDPA